MWIPFRRISGNDCCFVVGTGRDLSLPIPTHTFVRTGRDLSVRIQFVDIHSFYFYCIIFLLAHLKIFINCFNLLISKLMYLFRLKRNYSDLRWHPYPERNSKYPEPQIYILNLFTFDEKSAPMRVEIF